MISISKRKCNIWWLIFFLQENKSLRFFWICTGNLWILILTTKMPLQEGQLSGIWEKTKPWPTTFVTSKEWLYCSTITRQRKSLSAASNIVVWVTTLPGVSGCSQLAEYWHTLPRIWQILRSLIRGVCPHPQPYCLVHLHQTTRLRVSWKIRSARTRHYFVSVLFRNGQQIYWRSFCRVGKSLPKYPPLNKSL